jgi:hypothetical protein
MIDKQTKDGENRRKVIFVLGMHRSGTSAIARALNFLGCDLPKTIMPNTPDNRRGYWESVPIMELNDLILHSCNSSWTDWLPFPSGYPKGDVFSNFVSRARVVLKEEFGIASCFIMKDPRCVKLVPFWRHVFDQESIDPIVIIPIRNMIEVARSLAARNNFLQDFGYLLWLRHVLDAEFYSRGMVRAFTTYDHLLSDCVALIKSLENRLDISWPDTSTNAMAKVRAFLDPNERHFNQSSDDILADPAMPYWFQKTYAIMLSWAEHGENSADYDALDCIRHEFNASSPAFSGLIRPIAQHTQQLPDAELAFREKDARISELSNINSSLVADVILLRKSNSDLLKYNNDLTEINSILSQRKESLDSLHLSHYATVHLLNETIDKKNKEILKLSQFCDWLKKLFYATSAFPAWWIVVPKAMRRVLKYKYLARRSLFNKKRYLSRYPDVSASGVDPLRHYINHGILEGRII